jgi:two-component system, sensor histidine kinase and response regulator
MNVKQEQKTGLLITLLLIFIVLAAAIFFLLNNKKNKNEKQHLVLLTERYQQAYNTVFEQYRQLSETLYSGLLNRYDIQKLYHKLLTADEAQKDQLRQELLNTILPRYKELKKNVQLRQLHFHLPNNESFLRFHKPGKYGDDLTGIRETVAFVNREHAPISGFEEGRIFNGYRFVYPITGKDKTHLGSMEISFGPDAITSAIMKQYYVLSNIFIKNALSRKKRSPDQQGQYYTESPYKNYSFDNAVLAALKKVSRKDLLQLRPQQSIQDKIYAMAHSGRAMSVYDPSMDVVITTFPVLNPVTREMNAFLTIRSPSLLFKHEKIHLWVEYGLSLVLLLTFLSTFYLQRLKRAALEIKTKELLSSKEQLQRYISAIDKSGLGLLIIDDDYRIREMNKTLINWFGDQRGTFCYSTLAAMETPCPFCRRHKVIREEIPANYTFTSPQGQIFDVVAAPVRNQSGEIRMIEVFRDISDQKKVEQQLITAKEAAESANLAKSTFLSNMGHELRTPLNGILGYTQIFAEDSTLSARQQKGIQIIHQSGEHLLMLINDILDLSKIETGKMELLPSEFRLPGFLQEIENITRVRCREKGLRFSCDYAESLPVAIEADELRLRKVILNLLSNAVKFTEHGHCTFTIRSEPLDGRSVRLMISITDSGSGIAPEIQDKIFDPFQQTGERLKYSKGSGLGLSISRKIIELMGGTLQVSSPINKQPENGEGVGSCFYFNIDVALASAAITDQPGHDQHYAGGTASEHLNEEESIPFPPREILDNLIRLTRGGYIDAMLEQVEALSAMESGKYQEFAQRIMLLAEDFHLDELEAFITRFQKSSPND